MSQQKHRITLALGSNFSAEANIEQAKARLMAAFGKLRVSRSLVTSAIGIRQLRDYGPKQPRHAKRAAHT